MRQETGQRCARGPSTHDKQWRLYDIPWYRGAKFGGVVSHIFWV